MPRKAAEFPDVMSYRLVAGGRKRLKAVLKAGEAESAMVRHLVMTFIETREAIKAQRRRGG